MSASVRKRGEGRWGVVVEEGRQPARRCPTCAPARGAPRSKTSPTAPKPGRRFWVDELDGDVCPDCGGPLGEVVKERRQRTHGPYPRLRGAGGAEEAKARLDVSRQQGTYIRPSDLTVEEYVVDRWLPAVQAKMRPSTFASHAAMLRLHVIPRVGHVRLSDLDPAHLNKLYGELLSDGNRRGTRKGGPLSKRTVASVAKTVHRALADAVRWRLVVRNVAADADPPTPDRIEMQSWTVAETRQFLAHVEGDRLEALWTLLLTTGLRRGEALGLKWDDVDLDAGRLAVRRALVTVGYRISWSEPKTDAGRRTVALDPLTLDALRAHRRRQVDEQLRATPGTYRDEGLVFGAPSGEPLHPDAVTQRFERLVKAGGVRPIRLHDLRHTAATTMRKNGVPLEVVAKRLGHASTRVTADIYSHVDQGMDDEAAARLGESFLGQ
jgi:integrase